MRKSTFIAVTLCSVASALADVQYSFVLEPDQVVPPTASIGAGVGVATLNTAETQVVFSIQHGLQGATAATVRNNERGANGPVLFTLNYVNSNSFNGTWAINSSGVVELKAGRLYVQIDTDTGTYPNGEIRGQIDLNPNPEPGDVIISEIMYNPASVEGDFDNGVFTSNAEWIELFNTTYTDIQIGGWFFQDEDVDTNNDACTPMQSGTFPDFVLRSFEVVVVIPDGAEVFGEVPSVADFKAAWNLSASHNVIQLNSNGTAGGAIVGRNLSNDPVNDTFDVNDLPLNAPFWIPCDPEGFERPDNEIVTLNDGTQIIDVVNYDDAFPFTSVWPDAAGYNSISLVPNDYPSATIFDSYTAEGNDDGANWIAHEIGDDANGYEQVNAVGVYGGADVGSPCRLLGTGAGNLPPTAVSAQILTSPGATEEIFMEATDRTRPFFGLLLFIIKTLPQNGQLIDVASNKVITPAMLGSTGYLMPRIPFNHVRYINNGTCGIDSFTFASNDGLIQSQPVPVDLFVQCGDVVITEIMYNPDSFEDVPSLAEWVELYNTTDHPIDLAGWYIADNLTRSGDLPSYILGAGATVAVIPPAGDSFEFATAWSAPMVKLSTTGETGIGGSVAGSNLNNSGEALRLMAPGGSVPKVHDAVFYFSGFEDPAWPALSPDGPSIYVLPSAGYTAESNDDPAAWAESSSGIDGAYFVSPTNIYDGVDQGSPGYLEGVVQGSCNTGGPMRDGNGDGFVDLADFAHFALCMSGPGASSPLNCGCFDFDLDADVDLRDFDGMQRNLSLPIGTAEDGVIISEILDGTLSGGEPKFVEITNCSEAPINLANFRVALYANGSVSENFQSMDYGDMVGSLPVGESFVIANTANGPGDSFAAVYGFEADLYHDVANGNGNDVYRLLRTDNIGGDIVIDAYGSLGVDGTGTSWEYLDSHAESLPGRSPNGGIFNDADWSIDGANAFDGFSPAQLDTATTAGTHTCN
ncbi:MAG: lamin tail domain-containing protein [Phycisphaerales bacterium]|nr:lamin tail domain-containing protein [Phycisphaerales bacterium]